MIVPAIFVRAIAGKSSGIFVTLLCVLGGCLLSAESKPSPAPGPGGAQDIETRATFHCLSLYWTRADNGACTVKYRAIGGAEWRPAQDLWYDSITETRMMNQYRGSIVNLRPGASYEIELSVAGERRVIKASTWNENFEIKKTIRVGSQAAFSTTEGGSPAEGYVLYDGMGATIDQQDLATNGVTIKHSYVILRGLNVINAHASAVQVENKLTDIVVEHCDISNWGGARKPKANPQWGKSDGGIKVGPECQRVVIQRNRVHHPRFTSTRWNEDPADPHPRGPRAILLGHRADTEDWESNHVIRYNEFFSDRDHLFEDTVGGGVNWSLTGHPGRDSEIYCNRISHSADDLIEADGGGLNVRIWGNHLDYGFQTLSLQSCTIGPVYIFRNVFAHNMAALFQPKSSGSNFKFRGNAGVTKKGEQDYAPFRGRVYVYHNTQLHGEEFQDAYALGYKDHVRNVISRNNVLSSSRYYLNDPHNGAELSVPKGGNLGDQGVIIDRIKKEAAANPAQAPFNPDFFECSFDYDLFNRDSFGDSVARVLGTHGIKAEPQWRAGHGPVNGAGGKYQLAEGAPGRNSGAALPNFNLGAREEGGAADMGAHEFDSADMEFGVKANWIVPY